LLDPHAHVDDGGAVGQLLDACPRSFHVDAGVPAATIDALNHSA
jgi:hypothetical protein